MLHLLLISSTLLVAAGADKLKHKGFEDLLEYVDQWILDFDEDDDGRLNEDEMIPLVAKMLSSQDQPAAPRARQKAPYNHLMITKMADADDDGQLTRDELVDLLRRMKSFDGGYVDQEGSVLPNKQAGSVSYVRNWKSIR